MLRSLLAWGIAFAVGAAPASAQLFSEDFEPGSTTVWTVNSGPSDFAFNSAFDYSTVGIPAAPSGAGTRGLKLQANLTNGIFSGMSVSPTGESFAGDYTVSFDWWANFNGPFPAGGSGASNLSTFGIGTAGDSAQWPGGDTDSVWFGATSDGGSTADYRAYSATVPLSYPDGDPVYESLTRNSSDPYFAGFGDASAPAAQLALYPQQTGETLVGAAGMEWHQVTITVAGDEAAWRVDGLLIATIDLTTVTLGGGNIFFGHSDINATSSADPNDSALLFTLIDNVVVVPAPGALALMFSAVALALIRRR